MSRRFAGVAALSVLLLGTQLANGQSLPIKPIDVGQMTGILGDWVAAIIKEIKEQGAWARANSVGQFVNDLQYLSGQESALAQAVEDLVTNTAPGDPDSVVDALNVRLAAIRVQYQILQNDIKAIDPQWHERNSVLAIELGNFAHDGILWYCLETCKTPIHFNEPGVQMRPKKAKEIAMQLRSDVQQIRELAKSLQDPTNDEDTALEALMVLAKPRGTSIVADRSEKSACRLHSQAGGPVGAEDQRAEGVMIMSPAGGSGT